MATWKIYYDFDKDGTFTVGDDITRYVKNAEWNLGVGYERLTADENRIRLTLQNTNKLFSPENTASVYYGKMLPRRLIRVQSITSEAGTVTHWQGWSEKWSPIPGENGPYETVLEGIGPKQFFEQANASIPLMQNVTTEDVLEVLIGKVSYPPALTSGFLLGVEGFSELGTKAILTDLTAAYTLESGLATFDYVGDTWGDSTSAYKAIAALCASERGFFFFDRTGKAIFWNRNHFIQDTVNDGTITGNDITNLNYAYGGDIFNRVTVTNNPRALGGTADLLWTLDKPLSINPQSNKKITAKFSKDDAKISALSVVVPSLENGNLVMTTGAVRLELENEAKQTKITVYNESNVDAVVGTLLLKGQPLTIFNEQELVAEDVTSMGLYGLKEKTIDTELLDDEEYAQSLAYYEVTRLKNATGIVKSISLREKTFNRVKCINYTVGTRIRVQEPQVVHDNDYFITSEKHKLSEALKVHDVTYELRLSDQLNFWLLGVSGRSELGTTAILSI